MAVSRRIRQIARATRRLGAWPYVRASLRLVGALPVWFRRAVAVTGAVSGLVGILQFVGVNPFDDPNNPGVIALDYCKNKLGLRGQELTSCVRSMVANLDTLLGDGDARFAHALTLLDEGKPGEARPILLEVATKKAEGTPSDQATASAAYALLGQLDYNADPAAAISAYSAAVALDPRNLEAWLSMATLKRATDHVGAFDAFATARSLAERMQDAQGEGRALLGMARVEMDRQFPERAEAAATDSIERFRLASDAYGVLEALGLLGEVALFMSDTARAREIAASLERGNEALGDPYNAALATSLLGRALYLDGDHAAAAEALEKAIEQFADIGLILEQTGNQSVLGRIYAETGAFDKAETLLEGTLKTYRDISNPLGEAQSLARLGRVQDLAGKPSEAARSHTDAANLYAHLDLPDRAAGAFYDAAGMANRAGDFAEEKLLLLDGLNQARKSGNGWLGGRIALTLGRIERADRNAKLAHDYFAEAIEASQASADPYTYAFALLGLGLSRWDLGDRIGACDDIGAAFKAFPGDLSPDSLADARVDAARTGCLSSVNGAFSPALPYQAE